ncbi:MAG: hypothetical protein GX929_00185 [Clostridiales bacterium]|jgi:hypothetical protein|nr:hypothetical protein [Clostridiales bacterium]
MTKRKWIITTSSVLLVLLLMAGFMAVAAEYKTNGSDPLVSASYITDVLAPDTIAKVNETIDKRVVEFDTEINQKLAAYTAEIDDIIAKFESRNDDLSTDEKFINAVAAKVLEQMGAGTTEGTGTSAVQSGWRMCEIEKGQTYIFEVGGMILPRIGSATCFSPSSPGLINASTATELVAGGSLTINNFYVVTVAGRGFTATSSTNKFLIYGNYTVKDSE